MTDKLKPCPHCGAAPHLHEVNGEAWVHCDKCDDTWGTAEEAIAAWNTRPFILNEPPEVLPVVDIEGAPAATPDLRGLLDPEVYRRALDVVIAGGDLANAHPACGKPEQVCDWSDAIASERERRGRGNG